MIEERDNLLGAWAIHCDDPDCHMEVLGIDESDVESIAKTDGWASLRLAQHKCPDCVAGNNPAEAIKQDLPQAAQPMIPATPDHVGDLDDTDSNDDDPIELDDIEADLNSQHTDEMIEAFRQKGVLFDQRSGDTIPGLTAKAEDIETPEDEVLRKAREKRQRERLRASKSDTLQKNREAMDGVSDLLSDFDGMFGKSKTTWHD